MLLSRELLAAWSSQAGVLSPFLGIVLGAGGRSRKKPGTRLPAGLDQVCCGISERGSLDPSCSQPGGLEVEESRLVCKAAVGFMGLPGPH